MVEKILHKLFFCIIPGGFTRVGGTGCLYSILRNTTGYIASPLNRPQSTVSPDERIPL